MWLSRPRCGGGGEHSSEKQTLALKMQPVLIFPSLFQKRFRWDVLNIGVNTSHPSTDQSSFVGTVATCATLRLKNCLIQREMERSCVYKQWGVLAAGIPGAIHYVRMKRKFNLHDASSAPQLWQAVITHSATWPRVSDLSRVFESLV